MRVARIKHTEIENGLGIGMSLFVQGCRRHCKGCFNESTWDFHGGDLWDRELEMEFFRLVRRPHIQRISILGGEPLEPENIDTVRYIMNTLRKSYPDKKIWLYTGFYFNDVPRDIVDMCDYIVDGAFIEEKKIVHPSFKGSTNQNIIKIKQTG